jgi:electron transport complex protein RnfD
MSRQFETGGSPHFPPRSTVGGVMRQVLYALVPGVAAYTWFFGPGVLVQIVLASLFALALESVALKARGKPLKPFLADYSAIVTAVLFALCIPPLSPWWITLVGMVFAIVVAKHLYGGLGNNLFNPAIVGYVAVLISFPQFMTAWSPPLELASHGFEAVDVLVTIFSGEPAGGLGWDAVTSATALDAIRNGTDAGQTIDAIRQSPAFGAAGGRGWEWIALWNATGGLWLLWRRIISWHVPAALVGSVLLFSTACWLLDPAVHPDPIFDLLSGGLLIGAFFIATDPVSGCASDRGRLLFGAGIGILTLVIRRWGGYPEGIAFAVLLMNMAAPLIDRFTRPRIFGHGQA